MTILRTLLSRHSAATRCITRCSTNIGGKRVRQYSQQVNRTNLRVDRNNIVSSPFPEIAGFDKVFLHEHVFEFIDEWPDNVAVECSETGRTYTYIQLKRLSSRLAMSLRKNKILPREIAAIILPNIPEYAIVALGVSEAGICTALINTAYTSEEIRKLLRISDASIVFTVPSLYPIVKRSLEDNQNIRLPIIIVNDGTGSSAIPGTIKLEDLITDNVEEFSKSEKTDLGYDDLAILPFSSGTTGFPKAVELSHKNLCAPIKMYDTDYIYPVNKATKSQQEIVLQILPLFHIYGYLFGLMIYLRQGAKLISVPKFTPTKFFDLLKKYRPTHLYVVPPLVQFMLQNEQILRESLESTTVITSGAAPLEPEATSRLKKHLNTNTLLLQGYGMTEGCPCSVTGDAPISSVGYVVHNTQIRIVGIEDGDGQKTLGANKMGELHMRGPQVMRGYYKNTEATNHIMDGEWLKSGDLGYYDETGLIYIKGRLKEIIKVKGFQVTPTELEEVIRDCNKVQDVAVIGVLDDRDGEAPKAYVVPKKNVNVSEQEIKDFVAERVAKFKHLKHVQFVETIPKSVSGKILRNRLSAL